MLFRICLGINHRIFGVDDQLRGTFFAQIGSVIRNINAMGIIPLRLRTYI